MKSRKSKRELFSGVFITKLLRDRFALWADQCAVWRKQFLDGIWPEMAALHITRHPMVLRRLSPPHRQLVLDFPTLAEWFEDESPTRVP